jgi:uncharacterized membrane protein
MKRNRIVINLDEAQAAPGSGRRRRARGGAGRLLLIVGIVLLLLVAGLAGGGYLWWRNYQNSPAYSLALLADAAQRNDTAGVESIIDSDKVCDDFVAQVQQREGGSAVSAITSILPAQTTSAMQTVTPKLKQTVHDELMKEVQRLTEPAKGKPFLLVALAITSFADTTETNKVAQVKVNIKDEHLQLTMQPSTADAKRWRITAVQDDKLTKMIADGVTRSLTSTGSEIKDAIHKQLDKIK